MFARITICLLACILCSNIYAHRDEESLTTITYNPRTEMMEVVHRIHLHDAQYVLNNLPNLDKNSRDLSSLQGKAHIALQVENAFHLSIDNKPLEVYFVGVELEGDFILVLQEFFLENSEKITINYTLFSSVISEFTSRVILWIDDNRKTILLNTNTPQQTVTLVSIIN
jgi:hypothetical protein